MTVQHLGALHPVEQVLTLVLAFGPFVVLGVVVLVRRRREAEPEQLRGSGSAQERDQRER